MCVNDIGLSGLNGLINESEHSKCHGCNNKGVPSYCDRWYWNKHSQEFEFIEMCSDCGINSERTLDGRPFGGYDRALCNDCVTIENQAIGQYVYLYHDMPDFMTPDFKETLVDIRAEIRQEQG